MLNDPPQMHLKLLQKSKISQHNNSETVKKYLKQQYIPKTKPNKY